MGLGSPYKIQDQSKTAQKRALSSSIDQQQQQPSLIVNSQLKAISSSKNADDFHQQQLQLKKAEHALNSISSLDQQFLINFQTLKQQQDIQQYQQQVQQQQYQYQLYQQQQQAKLLEYQNQQKQQAKVSQVDTQIKEQAQFELSKIQAMVKQIKNIKDDQNERLRRIQQGKMYLMNVKETIEKKEIASDQILLKVEVEKENLKNLHKFIDIEEESKRVSKLEPMHPFEDFNRKYSVQPRSSGNNNYQRSPYDQSYPSRQHNRSFNVSERIFPQQNKLMIPTRLNNSFITPHQQCIDCGISIQNVKNSAMDASDDLPVFKVNSVIDWLDHRKHRTQEHAEQMKQKYLKSVSRLNEQKEQQDKIDNDWANKKVNNLSRLLHY